MHLGGVEGMRAWVYLGSRMCVVMCDSWIYLGGMCV